MMPGEMASTEKRVRRLEEETEKDKLGRQSDRHKLGQVAEDSARQNQAASGTSRMLTRGQSVGVIPGRAGNAPGQGTFRFLQLIDGHEYLLQPFADGDVTETCLNETGGATINNEYLLLAHFDGVWTAFGGDCVTVSPTRAPDPPEE